MQISEQCRRLLHREHPFLTNAANFVAFVNQSFEDLNWVGFYLAREDGLWLGPFQGKIACTFIPFGRGVCGTAAERGETIIVPDVEQFPGHIVCDPQSRSEMVVPLIKNGVLWGVFDLDSPLYNRFSKIAPTIQHLVTIFVDAVEMDLPFGVSIPYNRMER